MTAAGDEGGAQGAPATGPGEVVIPQAVDLRSPLGAAFFLGHLGAFVRDRCPSPGERLPFVAIHLADGEVLDVCHVAGVAPAWVALAVWDEAEPSEGGAPRPMRTEIVPYSTIVRVTVRAAPRRGGHIGFDHSHAPELVGRPTEALSPADALRAAAGG